MELFIDTHAHLDDPRFDKDLDGVISRAKEAGLKKIITVGCWDPARGFAPVMDLVERNGFVHAALGVHPHDARHVSDDAPFELIRRLALEQEKNRVVAVGETGLDYHYDNSPREVQRGVFVKHISLARELNLPLIIHSREADKDTVDILKDQGAKEIGGVFHCFSGGHKMAGQALEMGFYLSFTGVVTFPNATKLREIVKTVPIERILVETDCPYMAPVPNRGKRNEPSNVVHIAGKIAEVKGLSLNDVGRITTLNAENLFNIGKSHGEAMIAYAIRNSLYLNITNRCTNYCTFCAKFTSFTVKGHYLRLGGEPDFDDVIKAVGPGPEKYDEIVFCGYGEPLIRLDLVKQAGQYFKDKGCRIRIDTDGLSNLVHKRDILPELGFVDCVSVSLNAHDSDSYQKIVKTPYKDKAFPAILDFLKRAKECIPRVVATVVSVPGLDIEACRKVAEGLGVEFRVREYNQVG